MERESLKEKMKMKDASNDLFLLFSISREIIKRGVFTFARIKRENLSKETRDEFSKY